jgi:glycosyltransferase involved in cell wall biosynthesis
MRVALIQDQLLTKAGSERVFLAMVQEFKEAEIYTLAYNPKTTLPEFRSYHINTHWLNTIIKSHKLFKIFFPISIYCMQRWGFDNYDLIITSSATTAKYIKKFKGIHICYCYTPTRAIWNTEVYFGGKNNFYAKIFQCTINFFKKVDFDASKRVDYFIAISEVTRKAIKGIYKRESIVLASPIDFEKFNFGANLAKKNEYYLLVSRLEKWKLVNYGVEAFNSNGLQLIVIGSGPELKSLMGIAKDNIHFMGNVDDVKLTKMYLEAKAVIFTPELEYGLIPLEALAAGTPVIALGRGGVLETMNEDVAVMYPDPSAQSLNDAIKRFQDKKFIKENLISHAREYSVDNFKFQLRSIVNGIVDKNKNEV